MSKRRIGNRLPEAESPTHKKETILLVEDEEPVRRLLREVLTTYGYQVLVAEDGGTALAISKDQAPIDQIKEVLDP